MGIPGSSYPTFYTCIARGEGAIRWRRHVPSDEIETGHPSFNPASSTPACDGERVVAYFGSFGLICFDMGVDKLWDIRMPLVKSFAGNATSPAIVEDRVILYRGNYVDHFLLAVDKVTGKQLWKVQQDEPFTGEMGCTSCPIVADEWDLQLRQLDDFRSHYNTHGMLAVRIDGNGLLDPEQIRTLQQQGIPEVPSPLFHDGYVYFVKNGGVLTCLELETGKPAYRIRTRGTGTHYASPIVADGKLFVTVHGHLPH